MTRACWLSAVVVALGLAACGPDDSYPEVPFRVLTAPGDEPWRGASEIVLSLEQSGATLAIAPSRFPVGATRLELKSPVFGRSLAFLVEAVDGDLVLARGRSFPFDFDPAPPTRRPDVLVARVGLFVSPLADVPSAPIVAAIATTDGALLPTSTGDLLRYTSHDPALDGAASLRVVAHARPSAVWADLGGGLVLAVGGATGGATLYDAVGTELAQLPGAELADQQIRPAVATLRRDQAVLVLGGAPAETAAPVATVRRIEVVHDGELVSLRATRAADLPEARAGAVAIAVPIQPDASGGVTRVIVLGGQGTTGTLMSATSIDPAGSAAPASIDLGTDARQAGVAVLSTGLVLVAGGVDAAGAATGELRILSVRPSSLELVSPMPLPLLPPRADPAVATFGPGLVLLAGGRGASGPTDRADLVEVSLDNFPGDWVATGSLPVPFAAPRAVRLGDGTVLVAGAEGLAVWVPSRGP